MKKHIPNFITSLNLLCGCFAIAFSFSNRLEEACYFIIAAAVFDFLDGMMARLLKVSNALGEQLDSLSDMVSFGLAPGMMIYQFIITIQGPQADNDSWLPYLVFSIPLFSAYRLAKFNIDSRQTDSFIGLATPANATFFTFIILCFYNSDISQIVSTQPIIDALITNPISIIILSIVFSFLLIAEIPMFSLKLKNFNWKGNETRFTFLGLFILSLILFNIAGIPITILLYIVWSSINLLKKA